MTDPTPEEIDEVAAGIHDCPGKMITSVAYQYLDENHKEFLRKRAANAIKVYDKILERRK